MKRITLSDGLQLVIADNGKHFPPPGERRSQAKAQAQQLIYDLEAWLDASEEEEAISAAQLEASKRAEAQKAVTRILERLYGKLGVKSPVNDGIAHIMAAWDDVRSGEFPPR